MKTLSNTVGKKSFGQTMREGAKALGGRDVANYSLFFHSPTKRHRAGDHMVVIVPYIEIGRSSDCQVQFGDEFPTVSRKHAAIRWDNNRVMVKQLSATNTTTIRRYPQGGVEILSNAGQEAELTNGDQLQLSNDGPLLAFNATETKTSNMGFTQRLQLFSQQALRPYKTAVAALAAVLVLSTAGFLYLNNELSKDVEQYAEELTSVKKEAEQVEAKYDGLVVSGKATDGELKAQKAELERIRRREAALREKVKTMSVVPKPKPIDTEEQGPDDGPQTPLQEFNVFQKSVYFIYVDKVSVTHPESGAQVIELDDEASLKWSGTGFLTTDSRLITARHVIQGWRFQPGCSPLGMINVLETTGGKVNVTYRAVSSDGSEFTFTEKNVNYSDAEDYYSEEECSDMGKLQVVDLRKKYSDWAYVDLGGQRKGNIVYNRPLSLNLKQQETLHVMGYNFGLTMQSGGAEKLDPLYSTCTVAQNSNNRKMINVTNIGYGSGCSGGPVFAVRDGKAYAVGIVSYQVGGTNGQIVPVDNMY